MLAKKQLLEFIGTKLAHLQACVATLNEIRFFDLNVASEDFFASLLNAAYGYSLVNLNHDNLNKAAVDLGDKAKRLAVQVTSERTKTKIQTTVDKFAEQGLAAEYDSLKVLIIGERTGDYPTLAVPSGVTFSGTDDVIDIPHLIKGIGRLGVDELERIVELIRKEIKGSADSQTGTADRQSLDQIDQNQQELLKQQAEQSQQVSQMAETVGEVRALLAALPATILPDALASIHQGTLDIARDLLKDNRPSQALALLEKQKTTIWATANPATKARLLCAIAGAKLAIGAESEAARLFLEAGQYDQDDEKVLTNVAVGHLLLGQPDKAAGTARLVLDRNPANSQARSVLIQSSKGSWVSIVDEVPEVYRTNCEVAAALGFVARRQGDLKAAKTWLRTAIDSDPSCHPEIKGLLAETILHSFTTDPASPVRIGELGELAKAELEHAVKLFDEACNAFADEAALRTRISWLLNAAIATRLLGRSNDTARFIDQARRIAPDNPIVIYQRAIEAQERGDSAAAVDLAKTLKTSDEIPNAPVFLAQLLWEARRLDEATRVLRAFLDTNPDGNLAKSARQMLVELYREGGQHTDALAIINELIGADPTNVGTLLMASQLYRSMGKAEDADASLEKALRVVVQSTPSPHLFFLGNELGAVGRWSDAADVLEKVVDVTANSPPTRNYLHACYRSGKLDKALPVCGELRRRYGPLEVVTDIEVAILEQTGDLAAARSVCEEYVTAFPQDERRRVQLAVVYLRQRDYRALDLFLNLPPDWKSLPVEHAQQVAQLYLARKRQREAVEWLYEIRRTHPSGKVHLHYLQAFLCQGDGPKDWLYVQGIEVNTAVAVKDSSGEIQWYVIEDRDDADISKGELPRSHRLSQQLIGKKPGDVITLKESPMYTEQGTITEIKSKYLHAFHESAKLLEVRYPEQAGAFITVKLPEGQAGVKALLEKLGDQQDKRQQTVGEAEALYRNNLIPIGSIARFLGGNIFEAWNHLTASRECQVICSTGSPAERQLARTILNTENVTLVVDPIALMTIHALRIADEVVATVGRLGIAQSTIDVLTETLHKRTAISRKGFMTLFKQAGAFVRREVSQQEVEADFLSLERLIEWIGGHCAVLPWSASLGTRRGELKEIAEIIGDESLDTALIAADPARRLFSDDLRLRQLAKAEFGVDGVTTQPILWRAVEKGVIDRDMYTKAVVQLATAGYVHTSIDASVLLEAARQAEWSVATPFSDVVVLLRGEHCDAMSAVQVAAEFMRLVWQQPILPRSSDYLLLRLLDELAAGRNPLQVSEALLDVLSQILVVNPIAQLELAKLIHAWRAMRIGR